MLRPLNAPEAREPRTGRQPTTTEADVRPLRADFFYQFMFCRVCAAAGIGVEKCRNAL